MQIWQTLAAVERALGSLSQAELARSPSPPAVANLQGLLRAAGRVVAEQQRPRIADVKGVLQTMQALQASAQSDTRVREGARRCWLGACHHCRAPWPCRGCNACFFFPPFSHKPPISEPPGLNLI